MRRSRQAMAVTVVGFALGGCHETMKPTDPHRCIHVFNRMPSSPVVNIAGQSIEWISDRHIRMSGVAAIGENPMAGGTVDLTGDNFLVEEGDCPPPAGTTDKP